MRRILKNALKKSLFHGLFPLVYKWHARKPVSAKSVLFIEIRYTELTNNFQLLFDEFHKRDGYTVATAFLGNSVYSYKQYLSECFRMLKKLATAEIVFVDESSNVLAALPIRPETKMIQVWHGCGAFKRFGNDILGGLEEKYYNDYTFTTVSSPHIVDVYASSMGQRKESVLPIGISRTDVFFCEDYVSEQRQMMRHKYEIREDKKVILYAPTFRGNVQCAVSPRLLELDELYPVWKDEYVILYKGHPAVKEEISIAEPYKEFFMDANEEAIEALMCAADLCITDYSSLVFEYALLERPMFFFAYDYKEYVTERGFYYDYEDFVPGPICYTEEELIQEIDGCDTDVLAHRVRAFKDRFMSACDGNATKRIVDKAVSV